MNAEETTFLLRRLLESFVEFPRDLQVDYREMTGRTDWRIQGNINDQGKLVGKEASHVKAVKFLMAELGALHGIEYRLKVVEPIPGERLPESKRRIAAPDYRCDKMRALLADWLGALMTVPPVIAIRQAFDAESGVTTFEFTIACQRVQDHQRLMSPVEGDPSDATILTSLGTLFRAAGFIEGVIFKLDVPVLK